MSISEYIENGFSESSFVTGKVLRKTISLLYSYAVPYFSGEDQKIQFDTISELDSEITSLCSCFQLYKEYCRNRVGIDKYIFNDDVTTKISKILTYLQELSNTLENALLKQKRFHKYTNKKDKEFALQIKEAIEKQKSTIYKFNSFQKEYSDCMLEIFSLSNEEEIQEKFTKHLETTLNSFKAQETEIRKELDTEINRRLESKGIFQRNYALDMSWYDQLRKKEVIKLKKEINKRSNSKIKNIFRRFGKNRTRLARQLYREQYSNEILDTEFRNAIVYGVLCEMEQNCREIEMEIVPVNIKSNTTSAEKHYVIHYSSDGRKAYSYGSLEDCQYLLGSNFHMMPYKSELPDHLLQFIAEDTASSTKRSLSLKKITWCSKPGRRRSILEDYLTTDWLYDTLVRMSEEFNELNLDLNHSLADKRSSYGLLVIAYAISKRVAEHLECSEFTQIVSVFYRWYKKVLGHIKMQSLRTLQQLLQDIIGGDSSKDVFEELVWRIASKIDVTPLFVAA